MKGKTLVLMALAITLAACARDEDVKEDGGRRVELVEPSEAPFDLDEVSGRESNSEGATNAGSAADCAPDKCIANEGE